ncbi:sigma-54 dependent transcriptional regulator [Saccharophagus degradans]|uniref:sigma-54-dependent transcriptional regulator n=1 Tax=Saccharophagus degradans TaxID=86304 RepID=UPI0024780EAD|nr:sigma-54 dependent transcriptional regulator [Saccharophagus degradans]WGO99975.1 sigma-54 dependent transcriptional regulator [Saccharophagus degradans]
MTTQPKVLVIDDEPDIRELLTITLSRMDIAADTAADVAEAKAQLSKNKYNLCLTDMKLPDGNGIDIVHYIQQHSPSLPVALITAHGNMDIAIQAMKAGAFDFLNKPVDLASLRKLVATAIASSELPEEECDENTRIIGKSPAIQKLTGSIKKLARSQAPVYISGESGSGKELVARSIHELGPRSNKPFMPVNCGAIQKELMESELFGHKKGAFTGAVQDKQGIFQAAEGGTLFLDEVADLPLDMQVKLLRAIQEKAVRPVGAEAEISTDVRILCATHKNLEELVQKGDFRQDLFYRLNVIQLAVPPLRDRADDVEVLAKHVLKKIIGPDETPPKLDKSAINALKQYSFPGNVRELENILERAYTLCEEDVIKESDLLLSDSPQLTASNSNNGSLNHYRQSQQHDSMDDYLAEIEKEILYDALANARWNKTLAAKNLGISFRSLRYRLAKLGLDDDED